jgi:hypothetical protein
VVEIFDDSGNILEKNINIIIFFIVLIQNSNIRYSFYKTTTKAIIKYFNKKYIYLVGWKVKLIWECISDSESE